MNSLRGRIPVLFTLILLSSSTWAQTAREQLERFSDGLESLHAAFTQVVVSTDGRTRDQSGGEVWLKRPDRFRWSYGGDFPESMAASAWSFTVTCSSISS